ncbi:MAG TPA: hypothetical protein VFO32_02445 [Sphingomicrobium sp.]|nr:hypothetical protein [Sphingomicrobium sp.]
MDMGGINWALINIVGVAILFLALVWVVMRTRSKGKESSPARTEQATRENYEAEDRAAKEKEL